MKLSQNVTKLQHSTISTLVAAISVVGILAAPSFAYAESCNALPPGSIQSAAQNFAAKISFTLAVAERRLAQCNYDVLVAQRAYEASQADRVTAGQRPNPNLTIGASNINSRVGVGAGPIQDKTIDSSLRLEQLVERGGKAALREQQADAVIRAAHADWRDVIRQQRLQLRQNYFEQLYQQTRITVQREFAKFAHEGLGAVELRLKAGDIAPSEANRFRLDDARAQNDLRQAEVDIRKARLEFAKSIGAVAAALNIVVEPVNYPGQEGLSALLIPANLDQRADIVAAAGRIEAAEAARALATSIATRDVTLSAQFDRWPTSAVNQQGTGNSFSVYFSIPLSVRHANEGEVKRAAVDLDSARDVLIRLRVQALADADISLDGWRAAVERAARVTQEVLPLASEVARAAEFAYHNGATGVFDLLDARRILKQIELDAAQANADAGKAWALWSANTELMTELK